MFTANAYEVDESFPSHLSKSDVAEYLAVHKNRYHRKKIATGIIVCADTTVVMKDVILEKPANIEDAKRMIKVLSGNTHQVITGVCISSESKELSFKDTTEVTFRQLDSSEINYYVEKYKPLDKAGAYGIQEWLGMVGITQIKGSYYNVVGLPIEKVYFTLRTEFGITPHR